MRVSIAKQLAFRWFQKPSWWTREFALAHPASASPRPDLPSRACIITKKLTERK